MSPLAAMAVAATLSATPPSPATSPKDPAPALVSWKRAICIYTGCFLEPLIPDLRRELGATEGWVLSWPIHPLPTTYLPLGPLTLHASPFLEPQVTVGAWALRGIAGARLSMFPGHFRVGVLVEGGVLYDLGLGAVVGAGLSYDLIERHLGTFPWTLSLVVRRTTARLTAAPGQTRYDVSLDVMVPIAMFTGWRPLGEMSSPAP